MQIHRSIYILIHIHHIRQELIYTNNRPQVSKEDWRAKNETATMPEETHIRTPQKKKNTSCTTRSCQSGILNAPAGGSGTPHKWCCHLPIPAHTSTAHWKLPTLLAA